MLLPFRLFAGDLSTVTGVTLPFSTGRSLVHSTDTCAGLGFRYSFWVFFTYKKNCYAELGHKCQSIRTVWDISWDNEWMTWITQPVTQPSPVNCYSTRAKNSIHWSQHSVRFTNIREHCASRPWALRNCQNPWVSRVIRETWHVWCACVSVCLYPPPLFRHDLLTATKFGTHVRIDPGIIRTQNNLTHPTPGGGSRGILRGQKFNKRLENVMNCPENQ